MKGGLVMSKRNVYHLQNRLDRDFLKICAALKEGVPLKKKILSGQTLKKGKLAFIQKTRKHY